MTKTIGLDTNAVLAFRLERHPIFREVKKLFKECLENKRKIYLPLPVLLEIEWVLRSYYKQTKKDITAFLEELLLIENLETDQKGRVKLALNLYQESSSISFADCLIASLVKEKNYDFLTFDQDLKKLFQSMP